MRWLYLSKREEEGQGTINRNQLSIGRSSLVSLIRGSNSVRSKCHALTLPLAKRGGGPGGGSIATNVGSPALVGFLQWRIKSVRSKRHASNLPLAKRGGGPGSDQSQRMSDFPALAVSSNGTPKMCLQKCLAMAVLLTNNGADRVRRGGGSIATKCCNKSRIVE